jgi:hypothetical protein
MGKIKKVAEALKKVKRATFPKKAKADWVTIFLITNHLKIHLKSKEQKT